MGAGRTGSKSRNAAVLQGHRVLSLSQWLGRRCTRVWAPGSSSRVPQPFGRISTSTHLIRARDAHERLPEIAAFQHADEGRRCVLKPLDDVLAIADAPIGEKVEIARKHLIPHAITKHGLDAKEWAIDDEALLTIIRRYTREAGVRNLERELSTLIRKAVKE